MGYTISMPRSKHLILIIVVIIAVIGGGIYFLISRPADSKPPEPLVASEPTVLWTDARTLSVLVGDSIREGIESVRNVESRTGL